MTSHLAVRAAIGGLQTTRFKSVLHRSEERKGDRDIELLSLSSAGHLYPRTKESDRQQASDQSVARCLVVNPGDLVVNPMWLTGGSIAVSDRRGAVSPDYRVFRPSPAVWPRYVHHLLRTPPYMDQYRLYTRADTTFDRRVQQEDLDELPLPLPSIPQQRRIADFLDDQVARIDNIIAARRQQAGLLDEAFSALAGAKLWPRTIPPTWTVDKLNRWAKIGNGSTPKRENRGYWEGGDVPWLNSSVVNLNEVIAADQFVTESALAKCHLPMVRPGSVLVGLTGEGRTRGMATLLSIPSTINQHLAFVTGDDRYWQPGYLLWALRSAYGRLRYISDVNGSTKGGLTCGDLGDLRIPRPPLAEQVALVAEIEDVAAITRSTTGVLRRSLACLDEFKRSLITAAVTGEFDVSTADGSRVPA